MSRGRRIPAYVHHKPTGQARVRIDGKDFYLGAYGTSESYDRYDELIAGMLERDRKRSPALPLKRSPRYSLSGGQNANADMAAKAKVPTATPAIGALRFVCSGKRLARNGLIN